MKKTLIIFLSLGVFLGGGAALAQNEKTISLGQRSEEVKSIQEVLKTDKAIYPEGLVTGYFGPATKGAVVKLQARCGLTQTGKVDDETTKCIFPVDYQITVVSPNGGENWDRGQIQSVQWKVASPTTTPLPTTTVVPLPTTTSLPSSSSQKIMPPYPFWAKASIDLFRKVANTCPIGRICPAELTWGSVFVKHLATVNLFDNSYSWKISSDIPNSSDYVIRISTGQNILPLYKYEQEGGSLQPTQIWPGPSTAWDESDNVFAVSGQATPPKTDLSQAIKMLQEIADQLARAIQLLKELNQIN